MVSSSSGLASLSFPSCQQHLPEKAFGFHMLSPITYWTDPLYRASPAKIPIALAQCAQVLLIIFLLGLLGLPWQGPPRQFHLGGWWQRVRAG